MLIWKYISNRIKALAIHVLISVNSLLLILINNFKHINTYKYTLFKLCKSLQLRFVIIHISGYDCEQNIINRISNI